MTRLDTDLLIIGAGAAGLVTALSTHGRRVSILSPEDGDRGCAASDSAQGGIAAAVGADDSPARHLEDTLHAGCRQNSIAAARLACNEAPQIVNWLESLGVRFARAGGARSLHREAAHGRARVLHVDGDATGAAIMQVLRGRAAEARHVERLPAMRAVRLLTDSSGVRGVISVTTDGHAFSVRARDVVIATGGSGGLFSRTTNPPGACGDGPSLALAAGARCDDLEFVQFHPTALDVTSRPLPLLTEALRGAGARIVDDTGASLMHAVHPLAELAPRDVVARTIYFAQCAGRRVWLDATQLVDADVAEAFPTAFRACRAHGIDPRREPIPITPAAHYHMGGIAVDLEGRASLPRLWAVGEAACTGMHGANRLASNSLLEAVVFGRRLGRALDAELGCPTALPGPDPAYFAEQPNSLRELRHVMWRCMGLARDATRLAEGLEFVARLRELTPPEAVLRQSRLLLAEHMMLAAARRSTSCGAHHRSDASASRAEQLSALAT